MIAKYTPSSINVHEIDTFDEIPGGYEQRRHGALVATFLRKNMTRTVITQPVVIRGSTPFSFYREEVMPGQNVALTAVTENPNNGAVTFKFSNGNNRELSAWADAGGIADATDADPTFLENFIIGRSYRQSPDGANKTNQVGAGVSSNLLAATPLVYTPPE